MISKGQKNTGKTDSTKKEYDENTSKTKNWSINTIKPYITSAAPKGIGDQHDHAT